MLLVLCLGLSGCELVLNKLGIEDPVKKAALKDGEGKAVGGACRHSGRAIEDCYSIYTWLPKESIFNGWREMDAYMRENEIQTISPQLPPPPPPPEPPPPKKKKKKKSADSAEGEEKPAKESEASAAPAANGQK